MAKFTVTSTFELSDPKRFVMAGSILEGEIQKGMFVHISLNSAVTICEPIHSIEFARRARGREDVCLCFKVDDEALEFWRALNIGDEIIEITPGARTN
jgi:hypothetical protein